YEVGGPRLGEDARGEVEEIDAGRRAVCRRRPRVILGMVGVIVALGGRVKFAPIVEVQRIAAGLPLDRQVAKKLFKGVPTVADIGRLVAGAGVEGERRAGVGSLYVESVAAAAAVDGRAGELRERDLRARPVGAGGGRGRQVPLCQRPGAGARGR